MVDIGSSLCRFGTAGEDLPRHIFRSDIGVTEDSDESDHKIGDVSLRFVQSDVTIESVIGPDGATDWDNYASLMNYGLEECMKIDTTEYPLMVSNSDYTNYLKSSENVSRLHFLFLQEQITSDLTRSSNFLELLIWVHYAYDDDRGDRNRVISMTSHVQM